MELMLEKEKTPSFFERPKPIKNMQFAAVVVDIYMANKKDKILIV